VVVTTSWSAYRLAAVPWSQRIKVEGVVVIAAEVPVISPVHK
jgi:hypothetical protein